MKEKIAALLFAAVLSSCISLEEQTDLSETDTPKATTTSTTENKPQSPVNPKSESDSTNKTINSDNANPTPVQTEDKTTNSFNKKGLSQFTIIVDPGHGGKDLGGIGASGNCEKNYNNLLTNDIVKILKEKGFNLIFTRNTDKDPYISPQKRAEFANNTGGDLFLSIHHNMNYFSKNPKGFSVFYSSHKEKDKDGTYIYVNGLRYNNFIKQEIQNDTTYAYYKSGNNIKKAVEHKDFFFVYDSTPCKEAKESKLVAKEVYNSMEKIKFWAPNTHDKCTDRDYIVLRKTNIPAIIVEAGFISNPQEEKLVTTPENRKIIAQQICNGIVEYFNKKIK